MTRFDGDLKRRQLPAIALPIHPAPTVSHPPPRPKSVNHPPHPTPHPPSTLAPLARFRFKGLREIKISNTCIQVKTRIQVIETPPQSVNPPARALLVTGMLLWRLMCTLMYRVACAARK